MHQSKRNFLKTASLGALGITLAGNIKSALAQDTYPSHAITLVVPQPPGGDADALCRIVQPEWNKLFGQPLIINNRAGAAGNIGTALGARAEPDGYTITFVNQSTVAINQYLYADLGFHIDDLTPVNLMTTIDLAICVNASLPVKNLKEFIDLAKQSPGKYTYGSAGNGSANHLAAAMMASMAGINLVHVPYKGGGPAMIGLLGKQIDMLVSFPLAALAQIKTGKIKAIAVTGNKRQQALPDVPTVAESGLAGYEFISWMGLAIRTGTPRGIINKISSATHDALQDKAVHERLLASMMTPIGGDSSQFNELIQQDRIKLSKLIKQLNLQIS